MYAADARIVLALASCVFAGACAGNPAPKGWLPSPQETPTDPYGAWIDVVTLQGTELRGELIAVHDDSVFVLPEDGVLVATARADVRLARTAFYASQYGGLAAWATVGSIATVSNGLLAVGTLPLWLIIGPIAVGADSRAPLTSVRHDDRWVDVRKYARFPQGLPPALDRSVLRTRPAPGRTPAAGQR